MIICILLSWECIVQAEELLIDRIAAVVGEEIITYSDVKVELMLNLYDKDEESALQDLINRKLYLQEAEKFKITEAKEDIEKVQGRLKSVREYLAGERYKDFLREYGLTESDVLKRLTDQVMAEKFIKFRINFFIVISEEVIKEFYEKNREEFGEQTYSEVHDQIKMRLFSIESENRLKEYSDGLRKRAGIVIIR
ncbi:MAG: hypothetical protein IT392_12250 [Nitrospirae bacterium]|nr:hypothetical protein [Nitrospirota bacterium]